MIIDERLEILENKKVSSHTYLMILKAHKSVEVKPGQFLMLKPTNTYDPLNRRAFAIADTKEDEIWIYYDIVGKGTTMMSELKSGFVDVLYPLGKGVFEPKPDKLNIVIAGGIGISGVSLFCKLLKTKNIDFKVYYGVRSKEYLAMMDWFEDYNIDVEVYTEDGSFGKRGRVLEALEDFDKNIAVHACGPNPMLKALKKIASQRGFEAYLSLENPMACGFGVCLGCVVKTEDGYIRTCVEGPVFKSDIIEL